MLVNVAVLFASCRRMPQVLRRGNTFSEIDSIPSVRSVARGAIRISAAAGAVPRI